MQQGLYGMKEGGGVYTAREQEPLPARGRCVRIGQLQHACMDPVRVLPFVYPPGLAVFASLLTLCLLLCCLCCAPLAVLLACLSPLSCWAAVVPWLSVTLATSSPRPLASAR